jgi:hypothetical protein
MWAAVGVKPVTLIFAVTLQSAFTSTVPDPAPDDFTAGTSLAPVRLTFSAMARLAPPQTVTTPATPIQSLLRPLTCPMEFSSRVCGT